MDEYRFRIRPVKHKIQKLIPGNQIALSMILQMPWKISSIPPVPGIDWNFFLVL
jgi:hypothetical protein